MGKRAEGGGESLVRGGDMERKRVERERQKRKKKSVQKRERRENQCSS